MNIPFIVVDTKTGFCLASNNLKVVHTQANSKSGLAVLCNSVLLLWRNVAELGGEGENSDGSSCHFRVGIENCANRVSGATSHYFCLRGERLCVVFGAECHIIFEIFVGRLSSFLLANDAKQLKDNRILSDLAQQTLRAAFLKQCECYGIENAALLVESSTTSFSSLRGQLGCSPHILASFLAASTASGAFVVGGLQCYVRISGASRCLVAALGAPLVSVEKVALDDCLIDWPLDRSPGTIWTVLSPCVHAPLYMSILVAAENQRKTKTCLTTSEIKKEK